MNKIEHLSLNGHSLRVFLIVLEEGSVSKSAERLGVSQSAVSHSLEKLREAFDDALFVRSGRTIKPTARALALQEPIQALLDDFKKLTDERVFNPKSNTLDFKIAANDFQRDLIFPSFLRRVHGEGVSARLHFIPSGIPNTGMLRQGICDLIITPFPPEGPDIFQLKLFDDHLSCFYDAKMRQAPKTWDDFCESDIVEAKFADLKSSLFESFKQDISRLRPPVVSVPNFEAIEPFILGTHMITVAASLMKVNSLKNLSSSPLPFKSNSLSMYMIWHKRNHNDPSQQWFRGQIESTVKEILNNAPHPN